MRRRTSTFVGLITAAILAAGLLTAPVQANPPQAQLVTVGGCVFAEVGNSLVLQDDCETDTTINVPDGYTLDGNGNTITAVPGIAAYIVRSETGASTAHVTDVTVTASQALQDSSCDWVIGVGLINVSGSVTKTTVVDVHRGESDCPRNYGIFAHNDASGEPADFKLQHNTVDRYVEVGVRVFGNAVADVSHNRIVSAIELPGGDEIDEDNVTNGITFSGGTSGKIHKNHVTHTDNDYHCCFSSTAISLFSAEDVEITNNLVDGHVDVGVGVWNVNSVSITNNELTRGPDDSTFEQSGYGIWFFQESDGKTKAVANTFSNWVENIHGDADQVKANKTA